jgi:hypothetical protein
MTKEEIVKLLGRRIAGLDELCGSLAEGTDERSKLERTRDDLDRRQQKLAALLFEEQTQRYTELAGQIAEIDHELAGVIQDVEHVAAVLKLARRLLLVADDLIAIGRNVAS